MTFDPYIVLGVMPEASQAEIRKAYLRACKTAHPDGGGSAEAFAPVQRAYELLSDEARRAKYDATGDAEEEKPDNSVNQAIGVIIGSLNMIASASLEQRISLDHENVVKHATDHITAGIVTQRLALEKAQAHVIALANMQKRLRRKKGKESEPEFLTKALQWQIDQIRLQTENTKGSIKSAELALKILKDYEFDVDVMRHLASDYIGAAFTTSTAGGY